MRRALAVVFLSLLTVLFVSQAVIKTAWFQFQVQQRVRPLVYELLNMTVSWDELRVRPLEMQVELLGLRAYSGAATTGTPFLQTPRATAQISFLSLFKRTLEIDPIRVEKPIVRFARDDHNWINFLDIDKIDALASQKGDGTGWDVIVRRLILIDADADFVLTPIDLRAHITGLHVTGRFDSLSEHDRIPIEVHQAHGLYRMFGRDFQLGDVNGNLAVELMAGSAVDLVVEDIAIQGAYPNARLKASGRISDLTDTHIFHIKAHGETETNFLNDIFFDQPQLTGSAALSVSYDGDFENFKVGGRITSHSLLVNDINVTDVSVDLAASLHEVTITGSTLKAFGGEIKTGGTLNLDNRDWTLKLFASNVEPKQLKTLVQEMPRIEGSITAGFEGDGSLTGDLPFSGLLTVSSPGLIIDWGQEIPLVLSDSELRVDLQWDGDEFLMDDGQVMTSREEVGFAGSYTPEDGSTDLSLALQSGDLSVLQVITRFPISGWGTGDGTWTGTLSDPVLHFDFDLRDMSLPWFAADAASGGIDITLDEVGLTNVTAETQKGVVWLQSGTVSKLGANPEMDLRVEAHNVPLHKTLRPLIHDKVPIDGRFTGEFVLRSPVTAPTGFAEGEITSAVVWGEKLEYVEGRLDIEGGILKFDNLRGREGVSHVTASGRVDILGPMSVNIRGDRLNLQQIQRLREYAISGTGTAVMEVRIASPDAETAIDLSWDADQVMVSGIRLGKLTGELHKSGQDLTATANSPGISGELNMSLRPGYPAALTVAVSELDAMPFMTGLKNDASMIVSGKAEIRGLLSKWRESSGKVTVERFALRQGRTEIGNDGPLYLTLRNGKFQLDRVAVIGDNTSATLRGNVALDGAVDIQLAGGVELQFFTLFIDELKAASGKLEVDGTIKGSLQAPNIQASLRVKGGRMQIKSVNLLLEDMQVSGIFENKQILIDTLRAQIGSGTVNGGGVLAMDGFVPTNVSLYATLYEAEARIPSWMLSRVNGRVEMVGPVDDILLRGELEIVRAIYDERLDWETLVLRFKPRPFEPTRVAKTKGFHLDVGLHSAGSIFVKNNLADLKLRGDVRVVGYPPDIGITGNLQFASGNVVFRENVFSVVNGQVNFTDEERVRPYIDLQVKTRVQEIAPNGVTRYDDITVNVTGPPDSLQIELESSPPLSREDIISLLYIKRRTTEDIGGTETATAEAVSLAFKVNEKLAGFQSEVQDYFGFEQLILEPAFTETTRSGTMRLRAIKILSKDLTAELKTSLSSTDLDLRLGYALTEKVFMDFGWNSVPEDQVQSNASTFGNFKIRPRLHFEFQ